MMWLKERKKGGKGSEGRKTGAEGVRPEGEKGVRGKGRNKPGQVIKNQKKSEKLSRLEESKEASNSGLRIVQFQVFAVDIGHSEEVRMNKGHSRVMKMDTGHSEDMKMCNGYCKDVRMDTGHGEDMRMDTGHGEDMGMDTGEGEDRGMDTG